MAAATDDATRNMANPLVYRYLSLDLLLQWCRRRRRRFTIIGHRCRSLNTFPAISLKLFRVFATVSSRFPVFVFKKNVSRAVCP